MTTQETICSFYHIANVYGSIYQGRRWDRNTVKETEIEKGKAFSDTLSPAVAVYLKTVIKAVNGINGWFGSKAESLQISGIISFR
jgi:hypothetical protein